MISPGSECCFIALVAAQNPAGAFEPIDAESASKHRAMHMATLPRKTAHGWDMGDEDRRKPIREMSARKATDPLETDMPGLMIIKHDLNMNHDVLLVRRMGFVVAVDERPALGEIAGSRRRKQHVELGCIAETRVVPGEEFLAEPRPDAVAVFASLVLMAGPGELRVFVSRRMNKNAHPGARLFAFILIGNGSLEASMAMSVAPFEQGSFDAADDPGEALIAIRVWRSIVRFEPPLLRRKKAPAECEGTSHKASPLRRQAR